MIEELGPNMARTIVGDAYDPEYKYELETSEDGLKVIITNRKTEESTCQYLRDDPKPVESRAPIWDEEKVNLDTRLLELEREKKTMLKLVLAVAAAAFIIWKAVT